MDEKDEKESNCEKTEKGVSHLSSAAAFVEGGIQDACDDACSICLEGFCDTDPSTVTTCKHEFHLQCILEWCQRSSQCPMCWQSISLKDPTSQELLEAVERERNIRVNQSRSTTIFHHPTLGDFELQHLPVGASDSELEERIIQHLAAAAMGRAHHFSRRDGPRGRSSSHARPQFLVFSTHPNASAIGPISAVPVQRGGASDSAPSVATITTGLSLSASEGESSPEVVLVNERQIGQMRTPVPVTPVNAGNRQVLYSSRSAPGQSSPLSHDRAGPSDFQTFSDNLKTRLNAVSARYKEAFSKSTRGWRERLFSRNNSPPEATLDGRREANADVDAISHMIEHLATRENQRISEPVSDIAEAYLTPPVIQSVDESHRITSPRNEGGTTPVIAGSGL